ncbi:MAG: magnesium-translocating P-type ATPase [Ilumatobacteraceae bacterium]
MSVATAPAGGVVSPTLVDAAGRPAGEVLSTLGARAEGLTGEEVTTRLASCGPNVLPSRTVTGFGVLLRQLRNPLLLLLVASALVSALTGDVADGVIITAIVALSVGLGFVNEYRAEAAVNALHSRITHYASVRRDGTLTTVDVRDLVPGDIVDLGVGDIVPADMRLLEVNQLECEEAVLTGESTSSVKSVEPVSSDSAMDLRSCAFMGTIVHQGSGRGVVVATGESTAFGTIATGLDQRQVDTAFQVGLRSFSKLLVGVAAVLTISIFVINIVLARPLIESLLFSLAIAIGITPQLLPAIVSVSLAAGSRALAERKVLVKRLVVIEDLGNIQVLFTDKTGTLTEGTVTFDAAVDPGGRPCDDALRLGLVCNEATMTPTGPVGGNGLDRALWAAPDAARRAVEPAVRSCTRSTIVPFDHVTQIAAVIATTDGVTQLIVKGSPENVIAGCVDVPVEAAATLADLFDAGARVVAVATGEATAGGSASLGDAHDLTLVGFLTFIDRPKADAGAAIERLHQLGIAVKILTGDNGTVAQRVCHDIGTDVEGVLTGAELDALDDDALAAAIPGTTVFARVTPAHKARVVTIARRGGVDVGFMGDGVNDAIALHAADVGISVQTATDVAKDAADIVLLDKDLGVIADGVAEGRRIFANTLKYVLMATSSNFGNMFSAAGASLFLGFLPMLPSQIWLNNLLYDVGQLAIPSDNVDAEVMARPAAWDISFVRRFMSVFGPISSIFDVVTFFVMLHVLHASHSEFRSGWFVESLATQALVVFLIRTRRVPFFRSRPSRAMLITPLACAAVGAVLPFTPLAHPLGFTALPVRFFLILFGMVVTYLALVELAKARFYAHVGHPKRSPLPPEQRHRRRVARRAGRFRDRALANRHVIEHRAAHQEAHHAEHHAALQGAHRRRRRAAKMSR